jgi:uncharacterized protein (UPF0332 family)
LTKFEKQVQLARYRLKQAEESIDEAIYLYSGRKSPRSVINRTYYSMLYAILALLIFEPYSSSKHSGILSYFNKKFIKGKIFSEEFGRSVNKAFELRQRGDYREYTELSYEQVEPFIEKSRAFVEKVKTYLEEIIFNKMSLNNE